MALLILDSELATISHHETMIREQISQLPRSSSKEAFAASSAAAWKSVMMKEAVIESRHNGSDDSRIEMGLSKYASDLDLYMLLQRIGSVANDCCTISPPHDSQAVDECQILLLHWLETYRSTEAFQQQEHSLMMLWHSIYASLYSDLNVLEVAAGRDGTVAIEEVEGDVKAWAISPKAIKCMIHCMLLQRHFGQIPIGKGVSIHAAFSLYRCGIVWHCCAWFGDGKQNILDDSPEMSELQVFDIDLSRVFVGEIGTRAKKPLDAMFLRAVELLQHIRPWKVAERLSSTLLALLDNTYDLS